MGDDHNATQTFSVEAIRDRLLPDTHSTPAERMRKLCSYIEQDHVGWRARYMPDDDLASSYAKILMTRDLARIELFFEITPTQGPLVIKTTVAFLDYELEVPPLKEKCLQNKAIDQSKAFLINWLDAHVRALRADLR